MNNITNSEEAIVRFASYISQLDAGGRLDAIRDTLDMLRADAAELGVDVTDHRELIQWGRTNKGSTALVAFLHTTLIAVAKKITTDNGVELLNNEQLKRN